MSFWLFSQNMDSKSRQHFIQEYFRVVQVKRTSQRQAQEADSWVRPNSGQMESRAQLFLYLEVQEKPNKMSRFLCFHFWLEKESRNKWYFYLLCLKTVWYCLVTCTFQMPWAPAERVGREMGLLCQSAFDLWPFSYLGCSTFSEANLCSLMQNYRHIL